MNKFTRVLGRAAKCAIALLLGVSVLVPMVMNGNAGAAMATSRYVKISNSRASATDVTYEIGFTTATTVNMEGVVVDFCSDSPIIGADCTAPTGLNLNEGTVVLGQTGITGFTVNAATTASTLIISKATGTSVAASTAVTITLGSTGGSDGVTNPSTANDALYARILTYDTDTVAAAYVDTSPGAYTDSGGAVTSTGDTIVITATVQEQLTFCVSDEDAPGDGCTSLSTPAVTLGHGSPAVVDQTQVDGVATYMQVSSNASGNVIVRMKGAGLITGDYTLTNSNHSFTVANSGSASNPGAAQTAGTEFFGMYITPCATYCTAQAPYSGGVGYYGLDTTTSNNNVNAGFGSPVVSVTASTNSNITSTFGATASLTTPAGIYTANLNMMATGTY